MIKRIIFIILGCIVTGLGIIGIVLPLLPTTPLLLLAAYFFIRSSKRLYKWLIHHKTLGPYIYNYLERRAVTKNTKIIALSSMWLSLIVTMIFMDKEWVRYVIILVGIGVSLYILSLTTVEKLPKKVDKRYAVD